VKGSDGRKNTAFIESKVSETVFLYFSFTINKFFYKLIIHL